MPLRLLLIGLLLAGSALAASSTTPNTTTVRKGETVVQVAARAGISVARLRALNGLRNDAMSVGQVLKVTPAPALSRPAPARSALSRPAAPQGLYTVKRGEWLNKIARKFGVSVGALQRANRLRTSMITPGQNLIIPARSAAAVVARRPAPGAAPARSAPRPRPTTEIRTMYTYIRMGPRDTADSVARRYHLSVDHLRRLNGLSTRFAMMPGSKLLVPARIPVPIPPAPLRRPVTFKALRPLGVRVQIITVDLRHRNVMIAPVLPNLRLTFERGARVSQLARSSGARALINGGYFHPQSYAPAGDIVMQGRMLAWGRIPMALAITPDNRATIRATTTPLLRRPLDTTWAGMETVVATGPRILTRGRLSTLYNSVFRDPALFGRASRSAVGLVSNRDLVLVTTHAKLTPTEMGKVMARLGIRDALLLDGGSSAGIAWNGSAALDSVRKVSYGIGVFTNYTGRRYVR
ncbi:LysM peptidoglycan-binding domain-containing protein [Deinococcus koreensis]|uniref:Peptidoglycan-binding protein n=1 Tax=Deinococcus koreensis TaxID=2054903 RepID=A0A2K3UVK6_9DEIO|nr:LysM peptidoglycan-binding domain-containing protein [Deinococcus koreensis]PNY80550.1 peptidoglycan-binding protein [Deinococcus koreensis]